MWRGVPGGSSEMQAGSAAGARAACDTSGLCSHWNDFGGWLVGAALGFARSEGMCTYAKNGVLRSCWKEFQRKDGTEEFGLTTTSPFGPRYFS